MLATLRKRNFLPGFAALAAMTSLCLVLGQVFHCCRINEAVAALLTHGLEHLEGTAPEEGAEGHPTLVTRHAACHAPVPSQGESSSLPVPAGEPCLSEADLELQGLEPGSSATLRLFPLPRIALHWPVTASHGIQPPPLDTGDLPTYLLTKRLLV